MYIANSQLKMANSMNSKTDNTENVLFKICFDDIEILYFERINE